MKALILAAVLLLATPVFAQNIAYIAPDAAAPGMTVCVEIITPNTSEAFGFDGLNRAAIVLSDPSDTANVVVGPTITSWKGRMISVMLFIRRSASMKDVKFKVRRQDGQLSSEATFSIVAPQTVGILAGGGVIGSGGRLGTPSRRNTLVVDSMILSTGLFTVANVDVDPGVAGNQSYLPLTILSHGPIRIKSELTANAGGKNAVAGGGGGGAGAFTQGGDGYAGGGGIQSAGGAGSGSASIMNHGGTTMSGVPGGRGMSSDDQGGGGGTGHPFGLSGREGTWYASGGVSNPGGYGGGSAGGESSNPDTSYGGGGGGFALDGGRSGLKGDNRGKANGNAILVPMAGGSGAGAGNRYGGGEPGSGGGGGGAISLVSYELIDAKRMTAIGADGGSTTTRKAGGGGGGAGGAIQLSSHSRVDLTEASTKGGTGGTALDLPSEGGLKGGDGSPGRIRLNGRWATLAGLEAGTKALGPAVFKCVEWDGHNILVTGAGNPGDSIYLYFWNSKTGWSYNELRWTRVNANALWSYAGELIGDEDGYVAVVQQHQFVDAPYTAQPDYVMSHTSGIRISPKMLHLSKDTIDFGVTRLCDIKLLLDSSMIKASGCEPIRIDRITLESSSPNARFDLVTPTDLLLKPDSAAKSVRISFDPIFAGVYTAFVIIERDGIIDTIFIKGTAFEGEKDFAISADTIRSALCDSATAILTITNNSCRSMTLDSLQLTEPLSLLLGQLPMDIPAGQSRQVRVRYAPSELGVSTADALAYLRFMLQDGPADLDTLFKLYMNGVGGTPLTNTQDTVIDVGKVSTCSDILSSIIVPSVGCDSLNIVSATIGTPANGFSLAGIAPQRVAVGENGVVTIRFIPPSVGSFRSEIVIRTNGGTRKVILVGEGVEGVPMINTDDTVINLGSVSFCESMDIQLPIKNIGCDSLRIDLPVVTGDDGFSVIGLSPRALNKGETSILHITFKPSGRGQFSGTMVITTNGGTRTITFIGQAVDGTHILELIPSDLSFGDISFCIQKDSIARVRNAGCDTVIIQTVDRLGVTDFAISSDVLPLILAPDSVFEIPVRLDPSQKGPRNAAIMISSTDLNGADRKDTSIALSTRVVDGDKALQLSHLTIDFGASVICEELDTTLVLTNSGCDTLIIYEHLAGQHFDLPDVSYPIVIPPSESKTVRIVTIADTTGGQSVLTGVLTFISNSDEFSPSIDLRRGLRYPTRLRLEAIDEARGTSGEIVRFRLMLEGEVPPTMTTLQFDLSHNNDLLSFESMTGAGLAINKTIGDASQVQSFMLAPVTGAGVIGELTFKAYLSIASRTMLEFSNIKFEVAGSSFAPECIAVISDSGALFSYEFGCGDEMYQAWLQSEKLLIRSISPNPTSNEVTLELAVDPSLVEITIHDLLGSIVLRPPVAMRISVGDLPAGMYYIRVSSDATTETRRLTIVR